MRIGVFAIGIVVASHVSSVRADDFKDAIDAAYCVGVDRAEIDINPAFESNVDELKSKNIRREVLIQSAISRGRIDVGTVNKMKTTGYTESALCWKKANECAFGINRKIEAQVKECDRTKDALCEPTNICDNK